VPITIRVSGTSIRRPLLQAAVVALAGLVGGAQAQTAPQLLPYTTRLIAGGGTAVVAKPAACPVSGYSASDAYGDGCLATEIELGNTATGGTTPGARSAVADANGNVYFTDYQNGLVRRVDAATGIVTVVAGGGTSAAGTSSGALANTVKLSHPASIILAPNGDLYFGDPGNGQVFKVAATGGVITSTAAIYLVAGNSAGTYGYAANNATTTINAATQSYLRAVYGLAFDNQGDLFIVDEYTEAILAVNTNTTGTTTVNNVSIPAGSIAKIAGTSTGATAPYCVNGTASGYGCNFGLYSENVQANTTTFDSTYSVAVGPDGTVYAGNEYYNSVFKVSPAGVLSTFAGIQNSVGVKPTIAKRGQAGSFGVGSIFGITADANSNVYFSDASSGVIWRVDGSGLSQYVVAGGASTVCGAATDANGDGCPALQSKFGSSGTGNYATTTLPGPGIWGVSEDTYGNLYTGDTETNLVREIATGAQFGVVGANQPIDVLEIHFAKADGPLASGAYSLTAGSTNFSLGTATCTTNSDNTTDCLLPVTATPTVLGTFTGTLTVKSTLGTTANFALSGIYEQSPVTRTAVTATPSASCTGTTTYSTSTPIALQATLTANGPSAPTGTITFYANGTALSPVQTVSNIGTTASPVYGAKMTTTFTTPGTYTITATYNSTGDPYFKGSSGTASGTITSSNPTFSTSVVTYQQNTVAAGQTGLYSFTVAANVYTGTITFGCSGLPANSTCVFSPNTVTASGCSATSTVAVSILTTARTATSSIGFSGSGPWSAISMMAGAGLALLIGLRRRKLPLRVGQLCMAFALLLVAGGTLACGKATSNTIAGTPAGTYSITVTATGSTGGTTSTLTLPLTVN
jgi:hypothetical protein